MGFMRGGTLVLVPFLVLFIASFAAGERRSIPTTLEGPFKPFTRKFDDSLRSGSDDLPMFDPRVVKRVPAIFPEQITLALSAPDAMWVSWVSGKYSFVANILSMPILFSSFHCRSWIFWMYGLHYGFWKGFKPRNSLSVSFWE